MKKLIAALLLINFSCLADHSNEERMKSFLKEGSNVGIEGSIKAIESGKTFSVDEITPSDVKGKSFDSSSVLESIKNQKKVNSESLEFLTSSEVQKNQEDNKSFDENESFITRSDEFSRPNSSNNFNNSDSLEYTLKKCTKTGAATIISVVRELSIKNIGAPCKICDGHNKNEVGLSKKNALKTEQKYHQQFSEDDSIKSFSIDKEIVKSFPKIYVLAINWFHKDNSSGCDNFHLIQANQQEIEEWVYTDSEALSIAKSPEYSLIDQTCLDANSSKVIQGKEYKRKCWKEKLSYLSQTSSSTDCLFSGEDNCELISQKCLQEGYNGCALWELTFKCFSKKKNNTSYPDNGAIQGFAEDNWSTEYEPNQSLGEITAKFGVFAEIKKDLENTNSSDALNAKVFNGQKLKCGKSVSEDLLYDCCFNNSGLARQIGLSKCDSEELALAEMKEKGLCHYIGSYEEKMMGMWKSRDEHVFCCFSSKLARVLHEEVRKQLNIDWGKPKHPNCGGFLMEEISRLDFSKINLTNAVETTSQHLPTNIEEKLKAFQNKLKNKIEENPKA